ncbi:MAG: hypothetical protein DMG80_07305 [Acidobacteria bacterium]|nr:MAG: hypothetical protein DMG80_07305 [Acidobacteriota bacterium]
MPSKGHFTAHTRSRIHLAVVLRESVNHAKPLAALVGSLLYLALNLTSDFKNSILGLAFVGLSYPVFLLANRLRARER